MVSKCQNVLEHGNECDFFELALPLCARLPLTELFIMNK